jgi:N-acetylglucosaminyldiphosphoundecaprenol N-acetyl-beta-D-mannosaminyltransferase
MEVISYVKTAQGRAAHEHDLASEFNQLDLHRARNRLGSRERGMRLLNTWVDALSGLEVLAILSDPTFEQSRHLCYVNAHSLNLAYRDKSYGDALSRAHLVLNDGIGLDLAARMRGRSFPENLNGSDFTLRLLTLAAKKEWRVYLYGGQPGVAATARLRLCDAIDGLKVVGVSDGYGQRRAEEIVDDIRAASADVVIVALGQPEQELWLDTHLDDTGCHLGVGVGAFLDFVSGRVVRSPHWMNRLGIEWLFRLAQEPGRLWRRYLVGNPLFLWRAWRLRTTDASHREIADEASQLDTKLAA